MKRLVEASDLYPILHSRKDELSLNKTLMCVLVDR